MPEVSPQRQRLFRALMWGLTLATCAALVWLIVLPRLDVFRGLLREGALDYAAKNLSERDREELFAILARDSPGIFNSVPDAKVGRLLLPQVVKEFRGAEVVTNRAGLRSARPYVPKPRGVFRIVCVGDSMVMGTAGREEDRWGDQIEKILGDMDFRVDGKPIEVYSLGVGSWTALNASTYLASRLSQYQPDLALVMMVDNDIGDSEGVKGNGSIASNFSPEHPELGSGRIGVMWPMMFSIRQENLLPAGLGGESLERWRRTFDSWKRLEELLDDTGGRAVFSMLRAKRPLNQLFLEIGKQFHRQTGLESPLLMVDYLGKRLPHDGHPSREGHRLLALHFLHTLAEIGYLELDPARLEPLDPALDRTTDHEPDPELIRRLQRELVEAHLTESIDFASLSPGQVRGFLGGIYPGAGRNRLSTRPYGSLKSAFLLKAQPGARRVVLELEVPPHRELYPFDLELRVDGLEAARLELASPELAGRHVVSGEITPAEATQLVHEIVLRTDSYWAEIVDPTMKSYRLVSVRQE